MTDIDSNILNLMKAFDYGMITHEQFSELIKRSLSDEEES